MDVVIQIKKTPDTDGMCEVLNIAVIEDDLFDIAKKKAIVSGLATEDEIFDFELLHVRP